MIDANPATCTFDKADDWRVDIKEIKAFEDLKSLPYLFKNATLDSSRTCIVWNERIDLPNDTIYEYGQPV